MHKLLMTSFLGLAIFSAKAQEYTHGLGLQYNYAIFRQSYTTPYVDYSGISGASVPGVVYKANLGFDISRSFHVSATAYPFLGFYLNSQTGGYFGAELPLLCELYFGDMDEGGGFIGAGGSMAFMGNTGFASGTIVGPQFEGGFQFPFRDNVVAVKLAYTYGLNKTKNNDPDVVFSVDKRSMFSFGIIYKFY